ncbi:hypothetical protein H0H93_007137, partial [Arthromyces matolae]
GQTTPGYINFTPQPLSSYLWNPRITPGSLASWWGGKELPKDDGKERERDDESRSMEGGEGKGVGDAATTVLSTTTEITHELETTATGAFEYVMSIGDSLQAVDATKYEEGEELELPIEKFAKSLHASQSFLLKQVHQTFLKQYLERDEIQGQIQASDIAYAQAYQTYAPSFKGGILTTLPSWKRGELAFFPFTLTFNITMKTIFLITSYILLVVASPIPPNHNRNNGINPLSTGIHESATLRSAANWVPTAADKRRDTKDPHHNQPDKVPAAEKAALEQNTIDNYLFGTTVDGKDVTLGLMHPERLQPLRGLPKGIDDWDPSALEKLADAISKRFTIIREVMNDVNLISQASRFVGDGNMKHLLPHNVQPLKIPARPEPSDARFKEQLLEIIKLSHQRLQKAMHNRNTLLNILSNIPHSNDIPNPNTPNVYVSYWRENKIISTTPRLSDPNYIYSFSKSRDGKSVTQGIGCREAIINIDSLPPGLDRFKAPELAHIAMDISDKAFIVRAVWDDRMRIQDAIKSLKKEPIKPRSQRTKFKGLDLSALKSGISNDRNKLIKMIKTSHAG